jgi:transposase
VVRHQKPPTKAYEKYLLVQLVHATVEEVSLKEELGYKALEGRGDRWISREVNWAEVQGIKLLGRDELALKKGPRDFVVIVTARAATGEVKVLAVLPDRQKERVKAFLASMPLRVERAIRTVCTDLYEGFITAGKAGLGQAQVVAARYHVAKL